MSCVLVTEENVICGLSTAGIPRQREPGGSDADGLPSGNRKRMLDAEGLARTCLAAEHAEHAEPALLQCAACERAIDAEQ